MELLQSGVEVEQGPLKIEIVEHKEGSVVVRRIEITGGDDAAPAREEDATLLWGREPWLT
jgi:hypothetical protein